MNYRFVLFDSPKMGNSMTPDVLDVYATISSGQRLSMTQQAQQYDQYSLASVSGLSVATSATWPKKKTEISNQQINICKAKGTPFQRKFHLPTMNFQGIYGYVSLQGGKVLFLRPSDPFALSLRARVATIYCDMDAR